MSLTRRRLLGGGLALPFLSPFRPSALRAAPLPAAAPKRLIVVHLPQGTVLSDHVPTGSETDFTLPFILEPLAAFQDRIITIAGLDNLMPTYNEVGNAHQNANFTLYSGRPFYVQDSDLLSPGGETVEHTLARRISATTPYLRLDFAIGGGETSDGIYNPTEGAYFWAGPNDPVSFFNDPLMTLVRLFGDGSVSPADAWAQRARRAAVLGGVLQSFKTLRRGLGGEDRARLDAHEEKLLELEKRVVNGTGECRAPSLSLPSGYRFGQDDDVSAPLMIELLVTAMSCDLTRVSTLHFANGHDPTFPWLTSENGGKPIVDTSQYDNWHAVVHADYQPGMEHVYRWYHEQLATLIQRLHDTQDADGDNMLDTTCVLAMSEFSSGRHWNNALPALLAGNIGPATTGRFLNYMNGSVEDLEAKSGYLNSGFSTNQLFTSLLRAFGGDDAGFGYSDETTPTGDLPGLLDG
jgi:hypothetical protein